MTDLKLDLELLDTLKSDLTSVVNEFKNAEDFSDAVATATGQDDLASKVEDFASKWNDKRKKMTTNVENIEKQIAAITKGFTTVDGKLAKALEEGAKENGGGSGGAPHAGGPHGGPTPQAR